MHSHTHTDTIVGGVIISFSELGMPKFSLKAKAKKEKRETNTHFILIG